MMQCVARSRKTDTGVAVMVALSLALGAWPFGPTPVRAQSARTLWGTAQVDESPYGILSNAVTNLAVRGDTIWVGPYLNRSTDAGATWELPASDSLFGTANRVFSVDVSDNTVIVGLGYNDTSAGSNTQSAAGFLVSRNGGDSYAYRFPQLDDPTDDSLTYGNNTLYALPVIVPQQSPPFDVSYDEKTGTLWVAGWASGIRRSDDDGRTWQRVVLPPEPLREIAPDEAYDFSLEPRRGETGYLNHMGFSVLADRNGVIWAGTPAGINRSLDGGTRWERFTTGATPNSLTGNWVVSIEEQVLSNGDHHIWMATWNAGEVGEQGVFGVTRTRDGGETFEQMILEERVFDFAFGGDEVIYAAAESGLLISRDGGQSWLSERTFGQTSAQGSIPVSTEVYAVAVGNNVLWVGTADGLMRSDDQGATWTVFRTQVPLDPGAPSASVPRVSTYAYPNPYSPATDGAIRIRVDVASAGPVSVDIFDFSMNRVARFTQNAPHSGPFELRWDGRMTSGLRLANGTYFYQASFDDRTARGKILVIE